MSIEVCAIGCGLLQVGDSVLNPAHIVSATTSGEGVELLLTGQEPLILPVSLSVVVREWQLALAMRWQQQREEQLPEIIEAFHAAKDTPQAG
jgi:hypothetical protein